MLNHLNILYTFSKIKAVIWDVDGALYQSSDLYQKIFLLYSSYLSKKNNIPLTKAQKLLSENSEKPSLSQAMSELCHESEFKFIDLIEKKINKANYISPDLEIVKHISSLSRFQQYILTNGSLKNTRSALKTLGFQINKIGEIYPFRKIFARDTIGVIKPDPKAFLKVIHHTGFLANQHLIVGDLYSVDIEPAKKIGMLTVQISHQKNSAHYSFATIKEFLIFFRFYSHILKFFSSKSF